MPQQTVTTKKQSQNVLDETPRRDIEILMGHTHAKVGSDNTGREEIMGKHGLGI